MKKKNVLKKVIALIVVLAMVLSLAACSKKDDSAGDDNSNTAEEEDNGDADADSAADSNSESTASAEEFIDDPEAQAAFAKLVDEQYKESMETSYLNLHTYYLDPAAAGFNMDNVVVEFGEAPTPEKNAEDFQYYTELKAKFDQVDRNTLTKEQRDEYDALEWELNIILQILDSKFDYYEQLFAPPNSLEANIISYMSTYELRSEREVSEFIELLDSLSSYVDSCIAYTRAQQEKKLLMTDFDAVIKNCDDALEAGMDSSVLSGLLGKVDELDEISADNKEKYKTEITEAYERSYLPIFQNIKDAMNDMKDGYNNTKGYAEFPNGKEYFEVLLNYSMGLLNVSADEVWDFLEEREELHFDDFYSFIMKDPSAMSIALGEEEETTKYNDYIDILEEVKTKMLTDHPEVKNLEYNVEKADPEEKLDEKNVAAYFLIPPVDGDHKQQMRINPSTENVDTIDSYVTITHEGFPGHMYQYAYMYDNLYSDYMKTLGVNGNVEGYAVYSEYGALDYLDDVSDAAKKVSILNSQLGYITYALADIGIGYKGWDMDDLSNYFSEGGYDLDDDTIKEIYDYLRCSPATYEPYGYGYELIAVLREKAEEELGDKFSPIEFNTALLNAGPSPYSLVERHINEYISSSK